MTQPASPRIISRDQLVAPAASGAPGSGMRPGSASASAHRARQVELVKLSKRLEPGPESEREDSSSDGESWEERPPVHGATSSSIPDEGGPADSGEPKLDESFRRLDRFDGIEEEALVHGEAISVHEAVRIAPLRTEPAIPDVALPAWLLDPLGDAGIEGAVAAGAAAPEGPPAGGAPDNSMSARLSRMNSGTGDPPAAAGIGACLGCIAGYYGGVGYAASQPINCFFPWLKVVAISSVVGTGAGALAGCVGASAVLAYEYNQARIP